MIRSLGRQMSFRDSPFWMLARPVMSLAVGVVVFAVTVNQDHTTVAGLLLAMPYALLAGASYAKAHVSVWALILLVLVLMTAAGLAASESSSTGGLVFLWLLPLQLLVAAAVLLPPFRRKR
jgi:hypothetical protein